MWRPRKSEFENKPSSRQAAQDPKLRGKSAAKPDMPRAEFGKRDNWTERQRGRDLSTPATATRNRKVLCSLRSIQKGGVDLSQLDENSCALVSSKKSNFEPNKNHIESFIIIMHAPSWGTHVQNNLVPIDSGNHEKENRRKKKEGYALAVE